MIKLEKLACQILNLKGLVSPKVLDNRLSKKTKEFFYNIFTGKDEYTGSLEQKVYILSTFINWDEGMIIYNKKENKFYMMAEDHDFEMHEIDTFYFLGAIQDVKEGWYNFLWEEE